MGASGGRWLHHRPWVLKCCPPQDVTHPTSHLECHSSSSTTNSPAPLGIFQNTKDSRGNKPSALG